LLLFFLTPALLVPFVDKFHSVMLFWLRPSRQIRPPIYSLKQSKLRKRRVVRYAILFFTMLILFIVLIVGPIIASKFLKTLPSIPDNLLQPTGLDNNDTTSSHTGTAEANAAAATTALVKRMFTY